MIDPKQIPDEVVLAARDVFMRSQDHISENIRAAIATALNAWPGAFPWTFNGPLEGTGFVLPLPQKDGDA